MTPEEFVQLVRSLAALPRETEWLEVKHNHADPQHVDAGLVKPHAGGSRSTKDAS